MIPPLICIVAKSGTGKTTLMEKLITEMKRRGFRVGAIKHDAHRFDIDHEGKDSWRFTRAGADTMVIASSEKLAMVKTHLSGEEPLLTDIVATYFRDVDIVLAEGFKKAPVPKVEVHRLGLAENLISLEDGRDPNLIAVASDGSPEVDVPLFDINDAPGLCNLIEENYLK